MAETYVALRRGPGGFEQRVCVKRIRTDLNRDESFVRHFLREARLAATLRHTNIVQVLDLGTSDDAYFMALELIDGVDLRQLLDYLKRHGRVLAPSLVGWLAAELAMALECAHEAPHGGVLHRDISPSNVLVSTHGEVKLADFGIAKSADGHDDTTQGVVKGKYSYMAPEYARGRRFEPRCDLFSLGVLLYEALAGARPYDGPSDVETLQRAALGEHRPIGIWAPGLPHGLAEIVERLIDPNPRRRFPCARALTDTLGQMPALNQPRRVLAKLVKHAREDFALNAALPLPGTTPTPRAQGGQSATALQDTRMARPRKPVTAAALTATAQPGSPSRHAAYPKSLIWLTALALAALAALGGHWWLASGLSLE